MTRSAAPEPDNPIEQADIALAEAAAPARHVALLRALCRLGDLADQPPLIALSSATLAAGLVARDRRLASAGGRMLASHLLATWIKGLVKDRVDRTRPHMLVEEEEYRLERGEAKEGELRSFPSGHTAGAFAVARALTRDYPDAAPSALGLAAFAGAVQIPGRKHFLSDVAAGSAIGLASEAAVHAAVGALERAWRDEEEEA